MDSSQYNKLIIADNLDVLPRLRRGAFDFIYLDPPFNTNRVFRYLGAARTRGGQFTGKEAFNDVWEWDDECNRIAEAWSDSRHKNNEIFRFIQLFGDKRSVRLRAYLTNMAVRLTLMGPLLKNSGSIWLHCDHTASHYIKIMMDRVFGKRQFINEIVWHYENASRGKKQLAHAHDVILGYGASPDDFYFNREAVLAPYKSGMTEWRYKKRGKTPPSGKTPDDVVIIPSLNANSKERTGHPTQKPRELLEFLMRAFCPPRGVVLDPFCGCGTTLDAAIHSNRPFIGVDINSDVPSFVRGREDGDLLFEKIDVIYWRNLFNDSHDFRLQAREANENRAAEIRIAKKMGGEPTPPSNDAGIDVKLPGVLVSVKNGLTVQLNALREIEGVAAHHNKKGVLLLTRRDIPASWRDYANKSPHKIAVISEKELDADDIPDWLRAAVRRAKSRR